MHKGRLVAELRRRKVLSVAAAYAVLAWGMIQVSATVLQIAGAPAWIAKVVLLVLAAGFPLALVFAWVFDLSDSGIVRTDAYEPTTTTALSVTKTRMVAGGVIVTVLALSGFAIWLRPAAPSELEFLQLTNFASAATAPALSPDGKMVVFLKGDGFFGNSAAPSQVFIKQLPDGEAVQLTDTPGGKATPTFSPNGSRVAFTAAEGNFAWHTYTVSTHGGHASLLLPNASGLVWIDSTHVLFSEVKAGQHMGVRRATLERSNVRDVYWPGSPHGMAHRSAISPDRRWVLIVEMDAGVWQPCRLVPLDGTSTGRTVGPPASQCTYAAWSPDGRWMYFNSNAGGSFHLWRQRFPEGEPQQLTHGPTEEEGLAVAADGRSLITSAGVRHNSIWLLAGDTERQISIEEYAFAAVPTVDGEKVFYLRKTGATRREFSVGSLVSVSRSTGAREEILPGHPMVHFDLSSDDRLIAFVSGETAPAKRGIWLAAVDRSSAPRRVYAEETERVFFDPSANIYFLKSGRTRYLYRLLAPSYAGVERVSPVPANFIFSISRDGEWAVVVSPHGARTGLQYMALSTRGLPPRVLCSFCGGGAGPTRLQAPPVAWSRDGRALIISAQFLHVAAWGSPAYTIVVPVRHGAALPALDAAGIKSEQDYLSLPGARKLTKSNVLPGATFEDLLFYETTTIRNLYRVTLPT